MNLSLGIFLAYSYFFGQSEPHILINVILINKKVCVMGRVKRL